MSERGKQIHLGLFEVTGANVGGTTTWSHPEHRSVAFDTPEYWVDIAQRLEAAAFDFVFLADSYGYGELKGVRPDVYATEALDLPRLDPGVIIPIMSQATTDLGVVLTASTMFEPPYSQARRLGTLDIMTRGRLGWNVVTASFAEIASRLFGQPMVPHDERYAMAEDHLEVVYRLLEDSWGDGALVRDKQRRVFVDPSAMRRVTHDGPYFATDGVANTPPSPQRTPLLFQAGTSTAGRAFGARHAECVFLQGSTDEMLAAHIAEIETLSVASGRAPGSVRYMVGLTVVAAPTSDEAHRRYAEFLSLQTAESAIASFAMFTGIDLGAYDPDTPLSSLGTQMGQSQMDRHHHGGREPRVGDVIENHRRSGSRGLTAIGSAEEVADRMIHLVDTTGVDGFLIEPFVEPGSIDELADLVVPELRRRGRFRERYEEATLRERFFGRGHRTLPPDHPGGRAR